METLTGKFKVVNVRVPIELDTTLKIVAAELGMTKANAASKLLDDQLQAEKLRLNPN